MQSAVAFSLLLRGDHSIQNFRFRLLMAFFRPGATHDQMIFQTDHRVAEWPSIGFGLGAIGGWIVRGGMGTNTISNVLDEGRPEIAACPLCRPIGDRMDGKVVVAVNPERRHPES